ncbi:hypothetical protein FHQ28_05405 [Pasteurellaceae bacterium USgator11]|nr:hypothetical protein FHQ19_09390 [Pasteurellaceae bacterium UScroc12]TNG94752.1 hypothetical protein FHQ20_08145 [Pasteurellaceae bacterium USgator41]TNG97723.1 hypothetical protein FHQ24_09935 [Pasteurellaceae bacterium UScroc31]TNH01684.1 hypothetical protein FHQ28_05405 [Pasteurellaceae bacterium USgator11]
MEKLTQFERLQLASIILPKDEISGLLKQIYTKNNDTPQIEALYRRLVNEMFTIAEMIEQKERAIDTNS